MKSRFLLAIAALAALLIVVRPGEVRAQRAGDANCDGVIDAADLAALVEAIFAGTSCAGADANLDGRVDVADVPAYESILAAGAEATATATPIPMSPTATASAASPSITATSTRTWSPGPSPTQTRTGTITRTPTRTASATRSPSPTRSATATPTFTRTGTPRPTRTGTRTGSATRTPTHSATPARTPTSTHTRVPTRTITPTSTRVSTFTPTVPPTRTASRTRTPTIDLPAGPYITHFGIAKADGRPEQPIATNGEGIPIYDRAVGSGFLILVEARRGRTPIAIGTNRFNSDPGNPAARPDLQIQSSRPLGNGSAAICDRGLGEGETIGGVPGINPPSFDLTQPISDALNDFGCRFDFHISSSEACTQNELGNFSFVDPMTQTQFCSVPAVGVELLFPHGDTVLTVQVRSINGTLGNQRQLIVRAP